MPGRFDYDVKKILKNFIQNKNIKLRTYLTATKVISKSLYENTMLATENSSFEQQLINYEKRISNILESFTDGFVEVNHDWVVTYWNKEAENLLEVSRNEMLGKNVWEVYQDIISLKFYSEYHRAMSENIAVRFEEYFPPKQIWLEVAAFPSGNGLSIYFKNITERKNTTQKLQNERKKYIDLFNLSPLPQWVYDCDTLQFLDVNKAAINHYGYSRAEFMNMNLLDIHLDKDLKTLTQILSQNGTTRVFYNNTVSHLKKSGEIIHVRTEGNTVDFENKNARLVMVIDRTVELKAKEAMEESIERFNIVSKATSDAIWDWNILTGEMIWNRGITGIFGHRKAAYDTKWWKQHVHPDDRKRVIKKVIFLIKSGKERLKVEYRFKTADGSYRFVQDRAFLIFNAEGMPVRMIGSMQDITSKVRHVNAIEEQNLRLKEISWIQSHKIRSPVAKILGLVSLISEKDLNMNDAHQLIAYLKSSSEELDNVIKEILKKTC